MVDLDGASLLHHVCITHRLAGASLWPQRCPTVASPSSGWRLNACVTHVCHLPHVLLHGCLAPVLHVVHCCLTPAHDLDLAIMIALALDLGIAIVTVLV